jgi:uncharacterized membrane protein HdeD (DUF308 family)
MIVLGAIILIFLAGFIVSVIVTLLKALVAVVGMVLLLGGVAMILFGGRWRRRRPWGWEAPQSST